MRKDILVGIFLIFFIPFLNGQEQINTPVFIRDSLDGYVNQAMTDWHVPGLAIGIVKNGRIIFLRGYGIRSLKGKEKVDENTLFMIGSNTKAFTATALALLEVEKKCSLNDKVVRWIPEFRMKDKWVTKEVNLTDILCHRMGLKTYQGDFMYWTSDLTPAEVIRKFGELDPAYGFRSKYGYTNAGFLIAGECIRRISGTPWKEFLRTRIFEPLQMNRTQAHSIDFALQENIACPHTIPEDSLRQIPFENIDNLDAAASMGSSVNDMSHWLLCQLDSGKYLGRQTIPSVVIEKTHFPQITIGLSKTAYNRAHFSLYALGWRLTDYEGREVIYHSGAVDGFLSSVTLLPEEGLGLVILTNSDKHSINDVLKWKILDAFLNLPFHDYNNYYLNKTFQSTRDVNSELKSLKDSVKMNLPPALKLREYSGRYFHDSYGFLDVTAEGNKLTIHFEHHPGLAGSLECIGGNRFLCVYSNPEFGIKALTFLTSRNRAKAIIVKVDEEIDAMSYTFIKKDFSGLKMKQN